MKELEKRFPTYSKLIRLYPKSYQEKYGQQTLQTTADMLDDAPSKRASLAIWTHVAMDLPLNLGRQQLQNVGGIMYKETPSYIKRNSIISGALLLPFAAALLANSIDKVINNHTLYNSWLWKFPVIGLWVMWLPLAAFLIALVSYLMYLSKNTNKNRDSWFKRLINLKRSWPILIPLVMALGIMFLVMFHDSAQCWIQTPNHLVSHIHQTWQCTVNNGAYPRKLI